MLAPLVYYFGFGFAVAFWVCGWYFLGVLVSDVTKTVMQRRYVVAGGSAIVSKTGPPGICWKFQTKLGGSLFNVGLGLWGLAFSVRV